MTDYQVKYPQPEQLEEFKILVAFAKVFQNSQITHEQYIQLERAFLAAHLPRRINPLFGWYYMGRERLKRALKGYKIAVCRGQCPAASVD